MCKQRKYTLAAAAAMACLNYGVAAEPLGGSHAAMGNPDVMTSIGGSNDLARLYANRSDQNRRKVSGVVKDATGEPVIGATVLEKGTQNGIVTDMDGQFTLEVSNGAVLTISFIGFAEQNITVGNQTTLNVILKEDTKVLEEVVVVGFGTQKKVNLTGSVSTVNSKAFKERPVQNAVQALQGAIPGLNIVSGTGELNRAADINIRGVGSIGEGSNSSPLILIDGMEGDLNLVNPQDIENVTVLKDAAASSIYGSRAPFGVILVTTKWAN